MRSLTVCCSVLPASTSLLTLRSLIVRLCSVLADSFFYVPHDALVPGVLTVSDPAIEEPFTRLASDSNAIFTDRLALTEDAYFIYASLLPRYAVGGDQTHFADADLLVDPLLVFVAVLKVTVAVVEARRQGIRSPFLGGEGSPEG